MVVKNLGSFEIWIEILVLLLSFLSPENLLNLLGSNPFINKMGIIINITQSCFDEYIKHYICKVSGKY